MTAFYPAIFVVLWSSAFISSKVMMVDATPFATLSLRFFIVFLCFAAFASYQRELRLAGWRALGHASLTGILFHGIYLGGVFFAQSRGMSAGLSALIVSLHPVLTAMLAGPLLKEKISMQGWLGFGLGFIGAAIVVQDNIGGDLPLIALISTGFSLLAVTAGTLLQRRNAEQMLLSTLNVVQAGAATLFLLLITALVETPSITPTLPFTLAFAWQTFIVSLGAFTILMIFLKQGEAARTSALFFMVPPTSALLSWMILGEVMSQGDLAGLGIATIGVFLATRKS